MREIVGCGNIETGFVPEKGKTQQGRVQQKNDDKDERKKSLEREFVEPVSLRRCQ
jgi:hypothetical protein